MTTERIPTVEVHCRKCGVTMHLSADHEDVAHPFPGPICPSCEYEELEEEEDNSQDYTEEDDGFTRDRIG